MSNPTKVKQVQASRAFGIGLPQEEGNFFIGDRVGEDGMENIRQARTIALPGGVFQTYAGGTTPLTATDKTVHYGPVPGIARSLSAQARSAS